MKSIQQLFFYCLVLWSASGCIIHRQRQVSLTELKDALSADKNSVVRVYLDKRGEFYPDKVYIPYKAFFAYGNKKSTFAVNEHTGNLRSYFSSSLAIANTLATAYGLPTSTVDSLTAFNRAEQLILAETATKINQLLDASSSKILIVMIHGFNDPNPSGDYQRMRDYIKKYSHINDAAYLEVYWDGLSSNQGNPGTAKIWRLAQLNAAYEANTVRSILNLVNMSAHIRIISHSLGASVGTGALFNTYSKWKNPVNQNYYKKMISTLAPQQSDIRIGMIAAAIPGVATFTDFNQRSRSESIAVENNNITRVVIGFKEADYALRKGFFKKKKYLSKTAGATSLGCNAETGDKKEIDLVVNKMTELGYPNAHSIIRPVDFNSAGTDYEEEHGLYYYMKNEAALRNFLEQLFGQN